MDGVCVVSVGEWLQSDAGMHSEKRKVSRCLPTLNGIRVKPPQSSRLSTLVDVFTKHSLHSILCSIEAIFHSRMIVLVLV